MGTAAKDAIWYGVASLLSGAAVLLLPVGLRHKGVTPPRGGASYNNVAMKKVSPQQNHQPDQQPAGLKIGRIIP